MMFKNAFIFALFILVGCSSKKQIYADRLVDYHNRHIYVNDSLDFSIMYFDVIGKKYRQTDSFNFKKTTVPPEFQKHLKQSIKSPSEILFSAHRASMSQEDIIAVLYEKQGELPVFSKKIIKKLSNFIIKDSLNFQQYQTASGYFLNNTAFQGNNARSTDFMENRSFNALRYYLHNAQSDYKIHEFHVPYNEKLMLRLIWIADVRKTVAMQGWEKIDDQNHYLELFSLNDSAKFNLKEVIPDNFNKLVENAFKEQGYLGAVDALLQYENVVETKGTKAQKEQFYTATMVYQSFLGNHKLGLKYLDKYMKPTVESVSDNYFEGSVSHDAAEFIMQKVEDKQVVIFNEAHSCGQHRAFMRDILRGLYEKGFRHLALETLATQDSTNEKGYPLRIKTGYYSNEPTFGQMLREAKAAGFQLWDYENQLPCNPPMDCNSFRENQQAENLKKIVDKRPNEKILVWVGHGHIYEGMGVMADRFKQKTGINPYTIEQTMFKETSNEDTDPAIWKAAYKKWEFKKPIVVTKQDSVFVFPPIKGLVDMQVFFPRTQYTNDYPDWMGNDATHFYELNVDKDHFKGKLLKVFLLKEYAKEVEGAIPVMNIPLSRNGVFKLFLKPDKYVAVIRDSANWEFLYKEFEIKP